MIIDTHCHYNISPLSEDWQQHWQKATDNGIIGSILVGVDAETSTLAVEIAKTDNRLLAAVGFHPTDDLPDSPTAISPEHTEKTVSTVEQIIRALSSTNPVAAIGEVGLDYFRLPKDPSLAAAQIAHQKAICSVQLRLAAEFGLPLLLHVRDLTERADAYIDMLTLLKEYASFEQPFILHCVSGPLSYIDEAISLGGYIGVAGNVTYKSAQSIRDIVSRVPKDRVLLETDAPFLSPLSHRGKSCEPWMITETAEFLTKELGISLQQIKQNTIQVFPQFAHVASQASTLPLQ